MAMKPTLQAKQATTLALSPQLQQALRLLQLSQPELEAALREAAESNPLLELDEAPAARADAGDDTADPEVSDEPEAPAPAEDSAAPDGDDREATAQRSDLQEWAAAEAGLQEHLLGQLRLVLRRPHEWLAAYVLVDALDEDGYLREPLAAIAATLPAASADTLRPVLHLLQACDPIGCGASDLAGCLRLQLAAFDPATPGWTLAVRLVEAHLDAVARHTPERLAALLGETSATLSPALALIRRLDPRPGARFAVNRTEYIQPDAIAQRLGGRWVVRMAHSPRLALNPHYTALIGHCRDEDDSYLRGQLQEARWLLRALEQRSETLRRVAQAIVAAQAGFLEHGPVAMRPLTLRELAEPLGLHESTVSRATRRKYLRTPRGTFEFKHFFGAGLGTGEGTSATAVQAHLRRLIAAETAGQPLSDQALADRLQAEGIAVARRTVTKYRERLGLPSAAERGQR